ncbi:MAG: hypothetical protein R3B40_20205 [Polyangiales bacterium]|nr:hypothetical protein [Myxococcales bacterium]MCB9659348.1 hypothetical protein [Sandaracinaceae bacterium]
MSWQPVERMPDESRGDGSPFRRQAEPVLAARSAPTLAERARLYLGSTPDLPSERAGRRILLTREHLYVERADGTKQRVRRADLSGRREERGRVVYGVRDGEDVALLTRRDCQVMDALDAQLGAAALPVTTYLHFRRAAAIAAGNVGFLWVCDMASRSQVWRISEHPARVLVFIPLIAVLYAVLVRPERVRVDTLGIHRRFGLVPILHENIPADRIEAVAVEDHHVNGRRVGLKVSALRRGARGNAVEERRVLIETFDTRGYGGGAAESAARGLGRRVAALLGAPLSPVPERRA